MKTILTLALLCLAAGCASQPKPNLSRNEAAKRNWSEHIGKYTYDQAIADLGRPAALGESTEGRWAEWILSQSPQVSFGFGLGSSSYGRYGATGVGVGSSVTPPPSGDYLRLQFGTNSQLKEWRKVIY